MAPSGLHELHESKFSFVSRIEFIRPKLSIFSAHVSGVGVFLPDHAVIPQACPEGWGRDAAKPLRQLKDHHTSRQIRCAATERTRKKLPVRCYSSRGCSEE